jgi:ankyrin repeat protein
MIGIHFAAYFGLEEVIIVLHKTRHDLNVQDSYSQTPLWWAATNGHAAVVRLLLATGKVNVDSKDSLDQTPLSQAAANGHEAVVKLLLNTGKVDVNSRHDDGYGLTPLY